VSELGNFERRIMNTPPSDLRALLRAMQPVRNPGVFVFASLPHASDVRSLGPVATMREIEGITVVVEEEVARTAGLQPFFRAAWITLTVRSDLCAVGLTAAFASALAEVDISCNVVAGAFHDHLFVPVESGERAMAALLKLSQHARPTER
jgi:uncharacterized protein